MFGGFHDAKDRHKFLSAEITKHDHAYYNDDAPLVDDAAYDALRAELLALEKDYPELANKNSPTQKVGAAPKSGFQKVKHSVPMLSLGNAFSED
ncbi:MAG: NAD-dependent DNA ligase LigA, partial [Pseudomonadota bacterium]|nr:NAD-dependent DNA ligase LigA [Pseudomonadota bacterium]